MPKKPNDRDSSFYPYCGNTNPTSTTLIVALKNDESAAWERFIRLYSPLIRFWCRKPGGRLTRSDRQDITQEVMAKVGRAIGDFDEKRPNRSLRAWLRSITSNTIADFLEKNEKRKNVTRLMSDTGHIKDVYRSSFELTEEPDEKIIILRQILKMLEPQFRPEYWEIFRLFINAEKTSQEVGEIMGMKADTVRKVKNRMLARIREEYEKLGLADDLPESMAGK